MILKIKFLKENGVFLKEKHTVGTFGNKSQRIHYEAFLNDEHSYLKLRYSQKDYYGKRHQMRIVVNIKTIKSNLGKGEMLLFMCPFCYQACRELFKVNYSINFKCRKCYSTIPYPTQSSSKMWRTNSQYFNVKKTLENLYNMRDTKFYKGNKTKRAKRIEDLEIKLNRYDYQRFSPSTFPLSLRKIIFSSEKVQKITNP